MMRPKQPIRWCAVYTRKSSEEGLEQDFNSLDAQREAGKAYVESQRHEGWRPLTAHYDDGGYSGGTLDRPALQRLLADIRAGKVQIVVVYKVDRLTRSLADFAKLIELFDAHGVSFVSVTQQFNTTTSMGRLMLNVLLSFAQFEREVTGERIRDKIAASKKKGLWMGGTPPLGYAVKGRRLVVNEAEAEVVRHIFRRYLQLGTVAKLTVALVADGYRTKRYTSTSGRTFGGQTFSRGHLYRILSNRIYLGEIVHKDASYPGEHRAIVETELWNRVQAVLAASHHAARRDERVASPALLKGLIFDGAGNRMSPSHAAKAGVRYRYYVSQAVLQGRAREAGSIARLPAHELEQVVINAVSHALAKDERTRLAAAQLEEMGERDRWQALRRVLRRIEVAKSRIGVTIDLCALGQTDRVARSDDGNDGLTTIELPFDIIRRDNGARVLVTGTQRPLVDSSASALVKAVARGYAWRQQLLNGRARSTAEIAQKEGVTHRYVARLLRLGFLAPDIIVAILAHQHPAQMIVDRMRGPVPIDWNEQRQLFGFDLVARAR
jgi:DNA invertase Pin-like site-specific DNA recombinase